MSGTYAALVVEAPAAGVGVLTGWGNWRFFARAAVPNEAYGRFDVDTFGHANFSDGWRWYDFTARWRGAEWTRGSSGLDQRPQVGEATLTLDNNDGALSRYNSASSWPSAPTYLGPDLLVQFGWRDQVAGTWRPAFTGLVDEAEDDQAEGDADRWATWSLVETTAALALVDGAEQDVQGTGEDVFDRLDRLLTDAGWEYGTGTNFGGSFINPTLQGTTLAGNRLSEIYLTADTGFVDAFADRYGRLDTWAKGFGTPWTLDDGTTRVAGSESLSTAVVSGSTYRFQPWAKAPKVTDSKVGMFNVVSIARAGGVARGEQDGPSVGLNGPSAYSRFDLLMDSDDDLDAWMSYFLLFFANNTLHMGDVDLMPELDTVRGLEAISRLDLGLTWLAYRTSPRQPAWADVVFSTLITGYTVSTAPAAPGRALVSATLHVNVTAFG